MSQTSQRPGERLQRGAFVGRRNDLAWLDARLATRPGLWLVGPPGVGRSRLAEEWGRRSQLEVHSLATQAGEAAESWLARAAEAVGNRLTDWEALYPRSIVLVVEVADVDAAAAWADVWQPNPARDPARVILVSDRAPDLARTAASEGPPPWPVVHLAGLSLEDESGEPSDGVALYLTRVAERVDPLAVPREFADVTRLVQALAGLPLWIELAASAALVFPAAEFLERLTNGEARPLPHAAPLVAALTANLEPLDRDVLRALARIQAPVELSDLQTIGRPWHPDPAGALVRLTHLHLVEVRLATPGTRSFSVPRRLLAGLEPDRLPDVAADALEAWALDPARPWLAGRDWKHAPPGARWALQRTIDRGDIARWRALAPLLSVGLESTASHEALGTATRLIDAFVDHPDATALDRALLWQQRAIIRRLVADLAGAHADALQALEALAGGDDAPARAIGEFRASVHAGLSMLHRLRGDDEAALRSAHAAATEAEAVGAHAQEIQARAGAVTLLQERGRLDEAEALIAQQLARCRTIQDKRREAATRVQWGGVHRDRGRPDAAFDEYTTARTLYEMLGLHWALGVVDGHVAAALHEMGRLDEAGRLYATACEAVVASDLVRSELMFSLAQGGVLAELGEVERAEARWARAEQLMARFDEPGYPIALRLFRALREVRYCAVAREAGETTRADACLAGVLDTIAWAEEIPSGASEPRVARLDDARYALRRVRACVAALPVAPVADGVHCLRVTAAANALQAPGQAWVDLRRRPVLQRTLRLLMDARLQQPGRSLSNDVLIAHIWKGERLPEDVRAHRLRATMWELRRLGLQDVLLNDQGYRLDERTPLEVVATAGER